jgi:amino-acid N-acetyltransferase
LKIEKAKISDVIQIHQLINHFANKGMLLPRSLSELYESIKDYFVAKKGGQVIGCAAMQVSWVDLAEIKAMAVTENSQLQKIGTQLVQACLQEVKEFGIPKVFCLTYKPGFFEKQGFSQIDRSELPHKIWGECYRCPKFPNCDEVALIYHLKA